MTSLDAAAALATAESTLAGLYVAVPMIRRTLVASLDGRALAGDGDAGEAIEAAHAATDATAAIMASSFALGSRLAETVGSNPVEELSVRTADGHISLYAVGDRAVLAVSTLPSANLGLLQHKSREAREQLAPLVDILLATRGLA